MWLESVICYYLPQGVPFGVFGGWLMGTSTLVLANRMSMPSTDLLQTQCGRNLPEKLCILTRRNWNGGPANRKSLRVCRVPVTAGSRPRQASWVACTLFRGDLHTIRNVNEREFWTRSGGGKKSLAPRKELLRLAAATAKTAFDQVG